MYMHSDYDTSNASLPSELVPSSTSIATTHHQPVESLSDDSMRNQSNRRHINVIHEGFSEPFQLAYTIPENIATEIEERERRHAPKTCLGRISEFVTRNAKKYSVSLTFIGLACFLYLCSWLYIGALWHPVAYLPNLPVALVNHDQGFASDGTTISSEIRSAFLATTEQRSLGEVIVEQLSDPSTTTTVAAPFVWTVFSDKSDQLLDDKLTLLDKDGYMAILDIPANFTEWFVKHLQSNATNQSTRTPSPTLTFLYNSGHHQLLDTLLRESIQTSIQQLNSQLGLLFHESTALMKSISITISSIAWTLPVDLTIMPHHSVEHTGQYAAIYLQVISVYVACIVIVCHLNTWLSVSTINHDQYHHHLAANQSTSQSRHLAMNYKRHQLALLSRTLAYTLLKSIGILIVISTLLWSIPLCFEGFQADGGHPVVSLIWLVYTGIAFISALNLLRLVVNGKILPYASLFILLVLIATSNIIMDYELSPRFYHFGLGFPLLYAIRGLEFLAFGSWNDWMWINSLVLLAWITIPLLICTVVTIKRHRSMS